MDRRAHVKARLAAFAVSEYWTARDEDADWEVLLLWKLIDSVTDRFRW
jgi:hypothetical protein